MKPTIASPSNVRVPKHASAPSTGTVRSPSQSQIVRDSEPLRVMVASTGSVPSSQSGSR